VCAYAIMSNHYHLVLYINQVGAESWAEGEVIRCLKRRFWSSVIKRVNAPVMPGGIKGWHGSHPGSSCRFFSGKQKSGL